MASYKSFLCILFCCSALVACRQHRVSGEEIFFHDARGGHQDFEGWFRKERKVDLRLPKHLPKILSITSLAVTEGREFIVVDALRNNLLLFDSSGGFIKHIVEQPRELSIDYLGPVTVASNGDVLMLDITAKRIHRFEPSSFAHLGFIQLQEYPASFVSNSDGSIITYGLYGRHLLTKYDSDGNLVGTAFTPESDRLKKFLARFSVGNITVDGLNRLVLFYPEKFHIYQLTPDLAVQAILKPSTASPWEPTIPDFPNNLSPYQMTPRHAEWWDRFLHADRVLVFTDSIYSIMLHRSKGIVETQFYLNVFSSDGSVYAEGLKMPQNAMPILTKNTSMYVVVGARTQRQRYISPELYEYKLRTEKLLKR